MNTIKTPPTKPGAYWWSCDEKHRELHEIYVCRADGKLYSKHPLDNSQTYSVEVWGGKWQGPLVPVEEVERAWREGFIAGSQGEDIELNHFNNSRARRVVEGEEKI